MTPQSMVHVGPWPCGGHRLHALHAGLGFPVSSVPARGSNRNGDGRRHWIMSQGQPPRFPCSVSVAPSGDSERGDRYHSYLHSADGEPGLRGDLVARGGARTPRTAHLMPSPVSALLWLHLSDSGPSATPPTLHPPRLYGTAAPQR